MSQQDYGFVQKLVRLNFMISQRRRKKEEDGEEDGLVKKGDLITISKCHLNVPLRSQYPLDTVSYLVLLLDTIISSSRIITITKIRTN